MSRCTMDIATFTLVVLLIPTTINAQEVTDHDRFRLSNECRPLSAVVELRDGDREPSLGLSQDSLQGIVLSQLNAARLYHRDSTSRLGVRVVAAGRAFSVLIEFYKRVTDERTQLTQPAVTWSDGFTGIHDGSGDRIRKTVRDALEMFVGKYLHVNGDSCGGSTPHSF